MKVKLYGIPDCDTVKAARAWLSQRGVDCDFHDFRKAGIPEPRLDAWLRAVGWEALLNRRGTTWRRLDEASRLRVVDGDTARQLALARPSIVKRPVVEWNGGAGRVEISVGFDPEAWAARVAES